MILIISRNLCVLVKVVIQTSVIFRARVLIRLDLNPNLHNRSDVTQLMKTSSWFATIATIADCFLCHKRDTLCHIEEWEYKLTKQPK